MIRNALIGLIPALCMHGAFASPDEAFAIYGAGGVGCGRYIEIRRDANKFAEAQVTEWANGYISGQNSLSSGSKQVRGELNGSTVLAYLDKFCRDEPLAYVVGGVAKLSADLRR